MRNAASDTFVFSFGYWCISFVFEFHVSFILRLSHPLSGQFTLRIAVID